MGIAYISYDNNFDKLNVIRKILAEFKKVKISNIDSQNYNIIINLSKKKIEKLNKRQSVNLYKKIYNVLYENNIFNVVFDNTLMQNELIKNLLYSENINIIDGKRITNLLVTKVLNYVIRQLEIPLFKLEVSFLVNKCNSVNQYMIKEVSRNSKVFNIITSNFSSFETLSSKLFEEVGVYIQVFNSNNKNTLKRSNIIFNIDFNEEQLKKCIFPKNCIIINLNKNSYEPKKSFNGILINDLKIGIPEKYQNKFGDIDESILCESILYKDLDDVKIILDMFKKEGFKIKYLIGKQSKLCKQEFVRLKRVWKIAKSY